MFSSTVGFSSSYVFWMGDLNFRIDGIPNAEVRQKAVERDFDSLKKQDQVGFDTNVYVSFGYICIIDMCHLDRYHLDILTAFICII